MQNLSFSGLLQHWRQCGQKGAFVTLTAVLLPMLVFLTGSIVDLGNIYIHKSYLQNSADSAALGGAKVGWNASTRSFNKKTADGKAGSLIQANEKFTLSKSPILKLIKDGKVPKYYGVKLDEEVPLYFWKYFTKRKTFSIDATAVVELGRKETTKTITETKPGKPGGTFSDLFIYSSFMNGVNSVTNPDRNAQEQNITRVSNTFDGHVSYVKKDSPKPEYSAQSVPDAPIDRFYTKRAQDEGLSNYQANAKGEAIYDSDTGADTTDTGHGGGYWSKASYKKYDMQEYWNQTLKGMAKDAIAKKTTTTTQNPSEKDWASTSTLVYDLDHANNNINLKINAAIPTPAGTDSNTPAYLIIKAGQWSGLSVINIDINADTERPLIIALDPSEKNQWAQIHLNINNGSKFRGIIYAPTMGGEGVLVNASGEQFSGSIIADGITLRGDHAHYVYEPIIAGTGGTGSGSSGTSSTTTTKTVTEYESSVGLTNKAPKIKWDD